MGFTLADKYPAIDPNDLFAFCVENHLRYDHWYGEANHFTNPLTIPGTGKLLLSRATLDDLKLTGSDEFRTLTITDNTQVGFGGAILGNQVKVKKVLLTNHEVAITPGYSADENTPYLVSIADPRWLYWDRGKPITHSYNLRDCDGNYLTNTLNGTVAWTWAQMLADLWDLGALSGLATAPTLPFVPDGTPENFIFHHDYPLNAIKYLLDRLACGLKYDPVADTVKIIRLGDTTDASALAATTLTTKYKGLLRYDGYQITPNVATFPKTLRIEFPVRQEYGDGTPNYTTLDRTVVPAAATFNTAYLSLEDDLTALRPPDAFSNLAALGTRADERQTHWQHKRTNHDTGIYREYGGILDLTTGIGCYYNAQGWEDRGGERGILTVLAAGKNTDRQIEDWRRRAIDPCTEGGTATMLCCPDGWVVGPNGDCCDVIGPGPPPPPPPPPPGTNCCTIQLFYSCGQNAAGSLLSPTFLFTVCDNGSVTYIRPGPVFVSNVAAGMTWTEGAYCGALPTGPLIPEMLALIPNGAASYCSTFGGGANIIQQCTDACNAAWGAGTQEAITCINACIQAQGGVGGAIRAPTSGGCSSCGGSAPMPGGYNVASNECHCPSNDGTMAGWQVGGNLPGSQTLTEYAYFLTTPGATGDVTGQTTLGGTIATYTVGTLADASFIIGGYVTITAYGGGDSIKLQVTYTDETSVSRTKDVVSAVTSATTGGGSLPIRCKAGTTITVASAGAISGTTYNAGAEIKPVR